MNVADLLTMEEAAQVLRCSKAHLSHVLNGKIEGLPRLPCISMGRRKLIRRGTLENWLASAEGGALSSPRQDSPQAQRERRN